MKLKQKVHIACAFLAMLGTSACGAPDLQTMKPSVWKPSALVIVVDHPAHWSLQDVESLTNGQKTVTKVVSCTETSLASVLGSATKQASIGLILVVSQAQPPAALVSASESDAGQRFEWIASEGTETRAVNVKQVVTDSAVTSYGVGWLAASLASANVNAPVIGWLSSPSSKMPDDAKTSALAGAYAAAANVNVVPVTLPDATATPPVQPVSAVPNVVIVDHPLTTNEQAALHNANALVLSLCVQPPFYGLVAEPGLPGPEAVLPDIQSLALMHWQSGTVQVTPSPLLEVNNTYLPANLQAAWTGMSMGLENHAISVTSAWKQVPAALRNTWQGALGLLH